jgi:Domain of unknown function (DUF4440)
MSKYLFDTPYWLVALVAIIGIGLLVSANARQEKRLAWAGAFTLFVGALLVLLSWVVETDQEKVLARTRELVKAVENKDAATLDRLLHPGARLAGTDLKKADLVAMAPRYVEQYGLKNIRISPEEPRQIGTGVIEVSGTIRSDAQGLGIVATPTDWQFSWVRTPDGWRVRDIRPLKFTIGNVDLQGLISQRVR